MLTPFSQDRSSTRAIKPLLIVLTLMLVESQSPPNVAQAQFYYGYRGFRPFPIPVAPAPYYGIPLGGYPVGSSVRIRSPYFSLSIGADLQRRVTVPGTSYRYGTYVAPRSYLPPSYARPSYRVVPSPRSSARYGSSVPNRTVPRVSTQTQQYSRSNIYSPGTNGGIPEVSQGQPRSRIPAATPSQGTAFPKKAFSLAELEFSARTLSRTLLRQGEEGQVWLEYLQPESIAVAARDGELTSEIANLFQRFEGITMNPELERIARTPGFQSTLNQLAAWVGTAKDGSSNTSASPKSDASSEESLREPSSTELMPRAATEQAPEPSRNKPSNSESEEFELLPSPLPSPLPAPTPQPSASLDI